MRNLCLKQILLETHIEKKSLGNIYGLPIHPPTMQIVQICKLINFPFQYWIKPPCVCISFLLCLYIYIFFFVCVCFVCVPNINKDARKILGIYL